ncbi:MAG TPA: helicase-related protein [Flavobacteriales bacterium]|nr:helicase-related protein [Flavobacteriales bacterium]
MIERLIRHGRKSILVFVPFVADAQRIASFLPGIAQVVWGDMPADERAKAIDGFKDGSIKVVLNVAVLGIGFDHPALDTIIDASPTMSLAKYYQRMGRGLRQHPSKKSTYILDMVGNSKMFGKVEDLRITKDFRGRWVVMSGNRQLTNKILRRPVEVMETPTYA